ncbi:MAG: STAS domain-containing protein [Phycisphaeraceae bacterium]|nr:STAS domain-containing protein [Phycisphaeraceae bacterium]
MTALPPEKKTPLIEIKWNGSVLHLRPTGPNVGQREAPVIHEEVNPYFKELSKSIRAMVLDLTDVHFMSSMGLGTCIALRNAAANVGAKPIIFGMNKELHALMMMMKIEKLYKIAASRADLEKLIGD